MEAILEPLVRSPKFLGYLDELNELRRREVDARTRFRQSLDEDAHAEFINGEVIVQMTARDKHMTTVRNIGRLLDIFVETHHLGVIRTEQALTGFSRNDYAPDICFWKSNKSAAFVGDTTIYPIPDFIAEVLSPSTEVRDRGVKFEDYAAHGVSEYWIVDPEGQTIEQYLERQGHYELAAKSSAGSLRGVVIEGLEMPLLAAFDNQANLAALRKLLA
jgi:Uma2 family endonuclease